MFFFYIHGLNPQLWIIVSNMCPIYQNIKPSGFEESTKKYCKNIFGFEHVAFFSYSVIPCVCKKGFAFSE